MRVERVIETRTLKVKDYMAHYRNVPYFLELCKECPNYGNSWACPPLDTETDPLLEKWEYATIVCAGIELPEGRHRIGESQTLLEEDRRILDSFILKKEKAYDGMAFGFSGNCRLCRKCSRIDGERCRHPESVRPPLEAYCFDVARTMSELFSTGLNWATDGVLPRKLYLVGALFHNCRPEEMDMRAE